MKSSKNRPEVSVVVPVYNVEQYLAECLDSILQQPGVELEVVCVDDCGNDSSIEILEDYRARDDRIRLVSHEENRGLSAARNTGIENARGDYVLLLDSDDLLKPDTLALQVAAIRRDRADMAYFHTDLLWERFPGDPSPATCSIPAEFVLFNQELRGTKLLNYPALLHATSSWSYIYSRDFLQRHNIRYDEELKRWEDRAFWTRVARLAESVSIVPVAVRQYRQRTQSITKAERSEEDLRMMLRQFNIILDEFELFERAHPANDLEIHTRYLHSYLAFRVSSWYLNSTARIKDRPVQESLIQGAIELFHRLNWSIVDIHSVKNYTRRLEIDVGRTVLLSGLLRQGKTDEILEFLAGKRLPLEELVAVEEIFEGRYFLPRKRFLSQVSRARASNGEESGAPATESWMSDVSLVIHIGFRKTGTTYVQRAFDMNRELLLREGVLFPETGLDRTDKRGGRPGACAGHLGFIRLVRNPDKEPKLWTKLLQECEEHELKTIFVSAENFLHEYQSIDLQRLRETFSGFKQVSFIVSVRRPDEWIESLYKELVCGGWMGESRDFGSFITENWQLMDYAKRLEPWILEFGKDAIDVIPGELNEDRIDGVKAVLRIINDRTGAGPAPESASAWQEPTDEESYQSPRTELVEAIRLLNTAKKPSAAYRREISWLIEKWNDVDDVANAPLMDPQTRMQIRNEIGPQYSELLQQFGFDDSQIASGAEQDDRILQAESAAPPGVSVMVMEDVVRIVRVLPSNDSIQGFFKRFYNKGMPKAHKVDRPKISLRQRIIAALILKPVLAVWNKASRETKEALRLRAKSAFGEFNVDRIVNLARKSNPGR